MEDFMYKINQFIDVKTQLKVLGYLGTQIRNTPLQKRLVYYFTQRLSTQYAEVANEIREAINHPEKPVSPSLVEGITLPYETILFHFIVLTENVNEMVVFGLLEHVQSLNAQKQKSFKESVTDPKKVQQIFRVIIDLCQHFSTTESIKKISEELEKHIDTYPQEFINKLIFMINYNSFTELPDFLFNPS